VSTDGLLATDDALSQDLRGPDAADLAAAALEMARRFASGATLWCAAPSWPWHAHHVAVELARPTENGKQALPVTTVPDGPFSEILRPLARAGDMLLVISGSDEPSLADIRQRAQAWGLLTVWIGAGPRPEPGSADYVLWTDGDETAASYGGRFALVVHLLSEFTLSCLEHPRLLAPEPAACTNEVCITCSDEGRLGEVVAIGADGRAEVRTPDGLEAVDTTLIEPARPGDLVLIHAGLALALVDRSPR
jgi:hypothetical protein